MLRYADAIVKRGVDKLIDVIAHSAEPQPKNTVTPQRKKRMRNDTDCAPQTTGHTTSCGLTEQTITPMDEQCYISYKREFEIIFKKVKSRKTSNLQRVAIKWSPVKIM